MSLIQVKNLNFEYPRKNILKNINFEIEKASVTALVGPNGAGKTTLLRCITSLETPMSGRVIVGGVDVHDKPREAHRLMGYLSDFFGVYQGLTVRQSLTYMAWCQKVPRNNLATKIEELAVEVDLADYLDKEATTLSRGYKQRLGVGLALVHDPKLLFLDEPASGLDPEARVKFAELILRLRDRGMTIIVSSHILAELEDYCDSMLVIRDGEIKSHVRLSDHEADQSIALHLSIRDLKARDTDYIQNYDGVSDVRIVGEDVVLSYGGEHVELSAFLNDLIKNKVEVYRFAPTKKTLQAVYMDLAEYKKSQG